MKNKISKIIYIYSDTRDYTTEKYTAFLKEKNSIIKKGNINVLMSFIESNKNIQLDTETNVTDFYTERELYVIQLGNLEGNEQHIIDYKDVLDNKELLDVLSELFKSEIIFFAANCKFEYKILYKTFGICIKNFKDVFLAAKLIHAGYDSVPGYNGLANLLNVYLHLDISKEEQTTFTGKQMSVEQLYYSVMDVVYLGILHKILMRNIDRWKLNKVYNLELKTVRPIADMEINGVAINTDALDENIKLFGDNAEASRKEIIEAFENEPKQSIRDSIRDIGAIQKEDEVIINWRSHIQKKLIIDRLCNGLNIKSSAKLMLKKAKKDNPDNIMLDWFINDNFDKLEDILISRHMDFLIDNDLYIKKGNININFNSPSQLLDFFRLWHPNLNSVGVKPLKRIKTPVIVAYKKYTKAQKLVSSFGEKIYTYIENDGKIHTNFNQIVNSGSRMSSRKPNLQQAPSTEQFRRIFVPDDGWSFVDSDYSSMELFIAAHLSQDKNMLKAIKNGYDLHSYSAYQIFGEKWIEAGGSSKPVGKPPTKEANIMRKKSKGASFSILYGTGVVAFSENNDMMLSEGKKVLEAYYNTFPELVKFFKNTAEKALNDLYVRESIFGRVRFFNRPTNGMEASHIKNAAMNYPPQAINGSVMKYALAMMKKYIENNNLENVVRLVLTVHDQQLSMVKNHFVDNWKKLQTDLMEKAASYAVPGNVIKVESAILTHWIK